jgi:hypothetical protein
MAVAAIAVTPAALSGCGSTEKKGDHVYMGNGISFRYPQDWKTIEPQGLKGRGLWTVMVAPRDSSGTDVAFVTEYRTPKTITKKNLASKKPGITSTVAEVARQAGGALLSGPTPTTMGNLPGYRFRISATVDSRPSTSRLVLVWKGRTEYFLNCQYLTKGMLGAEVERGCRMIIGSFELS